MSTLQHDLERIQQKLQQLVQVQQKLRAENQALREQLAVTTEEKETLTGHITQLQEQIGLLKMSSGSLENQDRKEMEKKINQYIREIDRCIAQLGE
jgi:regulator of replication initiation timing